MSLSNNFHKRMLNAGQQKLEFLKCMSIFLQLRYKTLTFISTNFFNPLTLQNK